MSWCERGKGRTWDDLCELAQYSMAFVADELLDGDIAEDGVLLLADIHSAALQNWITPLEYCFMLSPCLSEKYLSCVKEVPLQAFEKSL